MTASLYVDGLALIKVWVIGFFGFHISGIIHILLPIAVFAFLLRILSKKYIHKVNVNHEIAFLSAAGLPAMSKKIAKGNRLTGMVSENSDK